MQSKATAALIKSLLKGAMAVAIAPLSNELGIIEEIRGRQSQKASLIHLCQFARSVRCGPLN